MYLNLKQQSKYKNPNLIVICGYDYNSHWYSYRKYYKSNISEPIKLVNFLANSKTKILYIDTIKKVFNNNKKKNKFTFSRYEYAKKELGFKLKKKFKNVNILEIPTIKKNNKANIHGGYITKIVFNILIYLGFIKSIDEKKLKLKIVQKLFSKEKDFVHIYKPICLKIPRSHFLDRLVRVVLD